jgi:hypothetical protein
MKANTGEYLAHLRLERGWGEAKQGAKGFYYFYRATMILNKLFLCPYSFHLMHAKALL